MQAPNAKSNGISLSCGLEGWLPPKMPNKFLLLAAKLQVCIHPMSVPNGPDQQYQHMLRKLCKFGGTPNHLEARKSWPNGQALGAIPVLHLLDIGISCSAHFFCRLGAEQHIKVLGQVIGPSPQFQIIMNHIPAIWFQIWAKHTNIFWTIPAWKPKWAWHLFEFELFCL